MATMNRNNARFLQGQKPKLKKRLADHLKLREKEITNILQTVIMHIIKLGYQIDIKIPVYDKSFINVDKINALIDNWDGLKITRVISGGEFHSKSVNWLDQNSKKVSGPFFAKHFNEIKNYFDNYCKHINVSAKIQKHIMNYSCIYIVVEILSSKVKGFTRCKPQPLIRNTTVAKSNELHHSFERLCKINLLQLVKIVKTNIKKSNPDKKQNRIDCKKFVDNLAVYCSNLLNEQSHKLGISGKNVNSISNEVIPAYFKDSQVSELKEHEEHSSTMELDENRDISLSQTTDNSCLCNQSQETLIQLQPNSINSSMNHISNGSYNQSPTMNDIPPPVFDEYAVSNDIWPTPTFVNDYDTFQPHPNMYYNPPNYWYQPYHYPSTHQTQFQGVYYASHAGYHSTSYVRHNPMDLQPIQPIAMAYPQNNIIINQNISQSLSNNEFNIMPRINDNESTVPSFAA